MHEFGGIFVTEFWDQVMVLAH